MDQRAEVAGQRLIGDSRGLWGLPASLILGTLCAAFQGRGLDALVLSLGADFGCLANSFLKRRRGLSRGQPHLPWDHIDFVLGASVFYHLQYGLPLSLFASGLFVWGLTHALATKVIRGTLRKYEP